MTADTTSTLEDYLDPECDPETRVASLLLALSLDEKLSLCAGQGFWKTKSVERLGIKPFRLTDGPRGIGWHSSGKRCTAFPSGIAQAASWDPELLEQFGEALGQEARAVGGGTVLGPAINIARTPLNGRTFEYLSEDPVLNSELVVPIVKGIQRQGVAACVKHFAVNNQETDRMRVDARVCERALQEIYLPAFRAAVEEGDAWSIMAAYNAVNGVAACENKDLLVTRLREQWGFRGFVVSDWFAVRRTTSSAACVEGGLSLEMPGRGSKYRYKNLKESYTQDQFTEQDIDDVLRGLLMAMVLVGHLDPERVRGKRNTPDHQALACTMAESGMTLLKNEGDLLPLDPGRCRKIAALGPRLKKRNCLPLWGGSAGVWPPHEITPWMGLQNENQGRFEWVSNPKDADVVLLFVGLSHRPGLDSEVKDKSSLSLPAKQEKLITDTLKTNPNTVIVLLNGSPIAMPWVNDVPAILECWYPGMEGGTAIARTLFGDNNPSGKLPVTFPKTLQDSPAHVSARTFPGDGQTVHYDEELFVGYRHFDKYDIEPLFPFGHGLSYSKFAYDNLVLSQESMSSDEELTISLTVTNVSDVAGAEVVQLYVASSQVSEDRPVQALKGFRKVWLEAGATQMVTITVPASSLHIFDPDLNQWMIQNGEHTARLGSSSRDIRLQKTFTILEADASLEKAV